MLPSVPIFPVYNFFKQNIWHSIFDQFHFHHIFGDEMTVSSDILTPLVFYTLWRTMTVKNSRNISGTSWMAMRERRFKYLGAQQVCQQISIFFQSKFHNEGGNCQKSYFEVVFWQGSHMWPPKISTLADPPFTFLPISPRLLTNIRCPYLLLNIWVVYQQ